MSEIAIEEWWHNLKILHATRDGSIFCNSCLLLTANHAISFQLVINQMWTFGRDEDLSVQMFTRKWAVAVGPLLPATSHRFNRALVRREQ